jgi:dUTP pyrophosphatase
MNSNTSKKSQTTTSKKPSSTLKKASKKSSKSSTTVKPIKVECILHNELTEVPKHATEHSAGIDLKVLYIVEDSKGQVTSHPINKATHIVHTGVGVAIPEGHFGMLVPRSSLAKKGMTILNSPGIIDSDYRGEIMIMIKCDPELKIEVGDRIAQLIIVPYAKTQFVKVETLSPTSRGTGGFGSTGK